MRKFPIFCLAIGSVFLPQAQAQQAPVVSFVAMPDTLRDCDPPAVVHLQWDAQAPGVTGVKIFAVRDGAEKLFTFATPKGEIDTGPWVTSTTSFVLKDAAEVKTLAKVAIAAKKC